MPTELRELTLGGVRTRPGAERFPEPNVKGPDRRACFCHPLGIRCRFGADDAGVVMSRAPR